MRGPPPLEAVLDVTPDVVARFDRALRHLYVNGAVERVTGLPAAHFVGRTNRELGMPTALCDLWDSVTLRVFETGQPDRLAFAFPGTDGERHYDVQLLPERGADGGVAAVIGISRDVTELRRAQDERARLAEEVLQARKLESLGRLAGGVAHDFNNLLTVILGCSDELARCAAAGVAPAPEDVAEIRQAADRARDLTTQLLAFARRQLTSPVALDLNERVRSCEKLLRRLLGVDVALAVDLSPDLWAVRADPGQIHQIIVNLAVNARDAMPRGGRLAISTANVPARAAGEADAVALVLRDTGEGMSPEVQAHLFEPFYTTKPAGRGTGLGLATVHGIVQQSGGAVRVESAVGEGTTVTVTLPRVHEAPAPPPDASVPARRAGTESVLLVEDDPHVRAVALRALRGAGYGVAVAAGGEEALRAAPPGAPLDLLLSDVVMPGMSGPALAAALRVERPALRVLLVSGYSEEIIGAQGELPEGVSLLAKPFTEATLLDAVRRALDGPPAAAPDPSPRSRAR